MALDEQAKKVIESLLDLTGRDKVDWQETVDANIYLASVGKFVVTIRKEGSGEQLAFRLEMQDDDGLGRMKEVAAASEGGPDWFKLRGLFEQAKENAAKARKGAVSELLSSLEQIH